jgi:hypothetical protein
MKIDMDKLSDDADEFRKKYSLEHECCPKCGEKNHASTLGGYVLDLRNLEAYKDKNDCECVECGDRHITHDRVPKKEKDGK